jgi:hypothetical protein
MTMIDRNGHILQRRADIGSILAGCVDARFTRDAAHIKFTPNRLTTAAYTTLDRLIEHHTPARIRLTWRDRTTWCDEILPSADAARRRLVELAAAHAETARFLSAACDISRIGADDPHFVITELWRATSGHIDLRQNGDYIAKHIGRFLTAYNDDGRIRFGLFGPDWHIYRSQHWLTHCVGQPVEDQPDTEYGNWAAGNYRELMDIRAPAASINDVIVADPTGDGSKRLRYRRLNLPVTGETGRPELMTVSYNDESIDLRAPVRDV